MRAKLILTLLTGSAFLALAGDSGVTANSTSSFQLNGVTVNTAGVTAWAVTVGDTITAGTSPIFLSLRDGSRISLSANSKLRLESSSGTLGANLVSGSMQFALVSPSSARIFEGGNLVRGLSGSLSNSTRSAVAQIAPGPPPPPPQPPSPISSR